MGSLKNSKLMQAWLVLLLSVVFSVALAAVHIKLSPIIEENKTKETMGKIPILITGEEKISESTANNDLPLTIKQRNIKSEKQGRIKSYMVYDAFDQAGNCAGHVIKATGQGYADKIDLLLALDPSGQKIIGLYILDQKETPGLGNRITEKVWQGQYIGKSTDAPLAVIKGKSVNKNEIDAISGATISSRSVTDIINSTINDVRSEIALLSEPNNNMENK
jgi:electron transport complex protein RnfG